MRYVSTRGQAPPLSFEETMLTGLARDGGLYVPEEIPSLSPKDLAGLAGASYEDAAFTVMRPFIGDCFDDKTFRDLIAKAYAGFGHPARCPLVQTGTNEWILELHHGPTLAFKDVALQLMGQMLETVLARRGARVTIVGATSGDTGSAAMEAFRGSGTVDVFFLHPHNRVSEVQRRQMTTPVEPNVHAIALDGTFDDCQARVKDMFNDFAFRDEIGLAAANSINWARVLAQVVYYVTSAVALGAPHRPVNFCVPTGNFGDIFAGHIARRMGVPIEKLIIATNENDILHRTLRSGQSSNTGVHPTIAPSMDIQVSSNFERLLFELYDMDGSAVAQLMTEQKEQGSFRLSQGAWQQFSEGFSSGRTDEAETLATIRAVMHQGGPVLDPHTAIGVAAARSNAEIERSVPMVVLGTAHAAKFPAAVEKACGQHPALPIRMADLYDRPERMTVLANDLAILEDHIRKERRA
ncbi:MAG: threonine synthase [Pseudomonadota bacterium]